MHKTEFSQELELWYVIPAIRKELVMAMKRKGLKQKEIAKHIGLTEAAVSQYLSSKRASSLKFSTRIKNKIAAIADKLASSANKSHSVCSVYEIQQLCKYIRKQGILCSIHERNPRCISKKCSLCIT